MVPIAIKSCRIPGDVKLFVRIIIRILKSLDNACFLLGYIPLLTKDIRLLKNDLFKICYTCIFFVFLLWPYGFHWINSIPTTVVGVLPSTQL